MALSAMAKQLIKQNELDSATTIIEEEIKTDVRRSEALVPLTMSRSANGSYYTAVSLAGLISYSEERLSAYTGILLNAIKLKHPALITQLEAYAPK